MSKLLIGTAGIPISTEARSSQAGIKRLRELGLGCMEMEFVRSVQMKEPTAKKVKEVALDEEISLTVHAPYYVNLNSHEDEKVLASKERILKAARIGFIAGASSVTFHAAFYHTDDRDEVYQNVKRSLMDIRQILDDEGNTIQLRPETTGAPSQFGTVPEIVRLSREIPGVFPCVDFSHLHARSNGEYNTYEEFNNVLEYLRAELGQVALEQLHMHISGIDYGAKGEKKHLALEESDMAYQEVLKALIDNGVGGWLICESPELENDALLLMETYLRLLNPQR